MIKAVIFDVGGVLIRTMNRSGRLHWEERLGLAERGSEVIVFDGEMGTKAQLGEISYDQLWQWIGGRLNLPNGDLERFRTDFWAGDVVDKGLMKLIYSLRPRYQTAIISNATDFLRYALTRLHHIADVFDLIVCSAEEKIMKPDPRIYYLTLERLGRDPAEAVFIDDSPVNIAGAQAAGLHTIHFTPAVDMAAELTKLGLEIGD